VGNLKQIKKLSVYFAHCKPPSTNPKGNAAQPGFQAFRSENNKAPVAGRGLGDCQCCHPMIKGAAPVFLIDKVHEHATPPRLPSLHVVVSCRYFCAQPVIVLAILNET
jgi:hypothetical protein